MLTLSRDAASGLATGKRQHKPFTFTTEIDRSHPAMLTHLDQVAALIERAASEATQTPAVA